MNFGFVSIYSYRPHAEHLVYLSRVLSEAGHLTSFLTCDASLPSCHALELRGHARVRTCGSCIVGGFRGFSVPSITGIRSACSSDLDEQRLHEMVRSSSYTLAKVESREEMCSKEVLEIQHRLAPAASIAYENTKRWIRNRQLDAVLMFNGRIDMTRAAMEACKDSGIPFVCCERTWFGGGLHLVPNANCLSLKALDVMVTQFSDKALTSAQAGYAGHHAASRFLRKNTLEWRLYNLGAQRVSWPIQGVFKVLILPGSRNETEGHEERVCEWESYTDAIDEALNRMNVPHAACVLRCHPRWSERMGARTGILSEQFYSEWARQKGVHCIPSTDAADSYELMRQADLVIVTGGTSGLEAALLGKRVVSIGNTSYQKAGFATNLVNRADCRMLEDSRHHDARQVVRQALRFIYTHARRYSQFCDYVRAVSTTEYEYSRGAPPERLLNMLQGQELEPDDASYSKDDLAESEIVDLVMRQDWQSLLKWRHQPKVLPNMPVRRKAWLQWIGPVRNLFPVGNQ